MYYLKTEAGFDAAHFLSGYAGKCRNLHGHRWRVVAQIKGKELNEDKQTNGMLADFAVLKKSLISLCEELDHSLIYEKGSLKENTLLAFSEEKFKTSEVAFRPTAENFAAYFFAEMKKKGFRMHRVEVYETDANCAVFEE